MRSEYGNEGLMCFERAVAGLSKSTTWYDYGFFYPQKPMENKNVSGLPVKQFADFIRRRLSVPAPALSAWQSGSLWSSGIPLFFLALAHTYYVLI